MKKIKYLLFIFLLSIGLVVDAKPNTYTRTENDYRVPVDVDVTSENKNKIFNTPSVDEDEKVYDFAELLSDSEEKELYNKIKKFIDKNDLDVVIALVDDNPTVSTRDYAADFYDYNYFDINGIIFMIDMYYREYSIVATGRAMNLYSNSEIDVMFDEVFSYMRDGNYYDACDNFLEGLNRFVSIEDTSDKLKLSEAILYAVLGSLVVTAIAIGIMIFQCRMVKKANSSRSYLVEETKKIENLGEIMISTHTSKVRIDTNSGSGGGGSSSFSGSSGRSHSGGSRKF